MIAIIVYTCVVTESHRYTVNGRSTSRLSITDGRSLCDSRSLCETETEDAINRCHVVSGPTPHAAAVPAAVHQWTRFDELRLQ